VNVNQNYLKALKLKDEKLSKETKFLLLNIFMRVLIVNLTVGM